MNIKPPYLSLILFLFMCLVLFFLTHQRPTPVLPIPDKVVTLPEGLTNEQFADVFVNVYPDFDKTTFLELASSSEGYLFPDTYFFNSSSSEAAVKRLEDTFEKKTSNLLASTTEQNKKWSDIVIMASILEEEANTQEDFRLVAGILWKRISINMPLQVDVATSTYQVRGLPNKPLSNPGFKALEAALYPKASPYFFYLTGKDGLMHYAVTFDEHRENIQKYLR